jgi:RNA polymerase sigma-70 factor, ECF subfamily
VPPRNLHREPGCIADQAAFRIFYRQSAPALRAYIARSAGSVDAADDILQDAFTRLLVKAPRTLSEAEMRGYLYRTADRLIVDRWRQRQREGARDLAAGEPEDTHVTPEFDDHVNRAFHGLKSQQRALLWMAYVEEFDHGEIAAAAGVRKGSVRVLLSRARKALGAALKRPGLREGTADDT